MKESVWTSLISSMQNGQCILVLGPDIPTCQEGNQREIESVRDAFCQYLRKQMAEEQQLVADTTLFSLAQQYEDSPSFSTVNLKNVAASFFRNHSHIPGPIYIELARCPFSLVLTTCHDDLFAKALKQHDKEVSRYLYSYRGEPRDIREVQPSPSMENPAVYHLFGAYDDPKSLVLTENDLLDFVNSLISGRPKLPDSLRKELRGKTFLFAGFGIRHWYLRVLLKLLMRNLELSAGSVVLEPLGDLLESDREQTVLFYKRGTKVEVVDVEIGRFLDEFRKRFDSAGGYLGATRRISRPARVFISYERSDALIARQIYKALPRQLFDPWLDEELLEGGQDWNSEIEETITSSDYFVVLNSINLIEKQIGYVNKEIDLALDRNKYFQPGERFIVPIQVNQAPIERGRVDLGRLHHDPLRTESMDDDLANMVRNLSRDFQRRRR